MSTRSRTSTSMVDKSSASSPTTYNPVPARRRISKACNYCRQRKIKCNGNSPCLNCKGHNIECVYSKTIRKKKRQSVKKLTLQDLEKRMNKMDQKYDTLNDKISEILKLLKSKNIANEDSFTNSQIIPKKRGRKPKAATVAVKKEELMVEQPQQQQQQQLTPNYEVDDEFSDDEDEEDDDNDDNEIDEDEEDEELDEEEDEEEDEELNNDDEVNGTRDGYYEKDLYTNPLQSNNVNNPISPVESNNSVSTNDQANWNSVMTPTDNFSFTSPLINDQLLSNNKAYALQSQQNKNMNGNAINIVSQPPNPVLDYSSNLPNNMTNIPLDLGGMENKLNMLYTEFPLITSQLENDLYN